MTSTDRPTGQPTPRDLVAAWRASQEGRLAPQRSQGRAATSDLSIDEVLLLHTIGWEPVDMVVGAGVVSIPQGVWTWATGEITAASSAYMRAISAAAERMGAEASRLSAAGVVGVRVEVEVHRHHAEAVLVGTAVKPLSTQRAGRPFVSDLSTRDFVLLDQAGWQPLGLAFGAAFVYAPRRGAWTAISQKGQNVELVNLTGALYAARESAMERMQASAISLGAAGVVAVSVREGPMGFATHAMAFSAWGTAVRPGPSGHRHLRPRVVVPLDDRVRLFEAGSLRGEGRRS